MTHTFSSSWIRSYDYRRCPDGHTYFVLYLRDGAALLYADTPSWLPGLLSAYLILGRSIGRAYNRLIKGKGYVYQRVEGEQVRELRRLLK